MNGATSYPLNQSRDVRRDRQIALSFSNSHVEQNFSAPQITDRHRAKSAVTQVSKSLAISNPSKPNRFIRDERGRNTAWRTGALWRNRQMGNLCLKQGEAVCGAAGYPLCHGATANDPRSPNGERGAPRTVPRRSRGTQE